MSADIDFYFDFSSPYAYFASTAIDALAARHGRRVNWQPVLLGLVFKETGLQPQVMVPIKGDYARHDFVRTARLNGIDFCIPDPFPLPTQAAARAMLWLRREQGNDIAVRFAKAVFRAYFVNNIDISAPQNVLQVGRQMGLDADALAAGLNEPEIKDQLKRGTEAAMQRGVFGAPFVIADGEPFWGFDRFGQLDAFLGQHVAQPEPASQRGVQSMVEQATRRIRRYTVEEVRQKLQDPNVQLVDVRDVRELEREGVVPGAFHAPRGMLEFWVDPASPYHKPIFSEPREFIFFCAAGWRSALATATVQDMGLANVADIEGGFSAWKAAGAPVTQKAKQA